MFSIKAPYDYSICLYLWFMQNYVGGWYQEGPIYFFSVWTLFLQFYLYIKPFLLFNGFWYPFGKANEYWSTSLFLSSCLFHEPVLKTFWKADSTVWVTVGARSVSYRQRSCSLGSKLRLPQICLWHLVLHGSASRCCLALTFRVSFFLWLEGKWQADSEGGTMWTS